MVKSKALIKTVKALAGKHGATALTIFAAIGVVATAVLTNQARPEADERIQRAKEDKAIKEAEEKGENPDFDHVTLTTGEKIKAAFPAYIKVIIVAGVTIAFIVGSRVISIRQVGDIAAAYNIAQTMEEQATKYAGKYEEKVKEIIGEEKAEEVKAEVVNDLGKDTHAKIVSYGDDWVEDQIARAIHTGHGNVLMYDEIIGRFFYSSPEWVRKAANDVNYDAVNEGFGMKSLNDFYDANDLPNVEAGESLMWDILGRDGQIGVSFIGSYDLLDGKYPYVLMKFDRNPHGFGGKVYA